MYPLSPIPILLAVKSEPRELTPTIIEAAYATAVRVLRDAGNSARAAFENQAIALLIGGVTPLLMNLCFGWPAFLVILGIAADNTVAYLSDILKPYLFAEDFEGEWKQQCDVIDVVAVARVAAARTRAVDRAGIPTYEAIARSSAPLATYTRAGLLIAILPLSWGSLFYPSEADEAARVYTFVVIVIPIIARLLLGAAAAAWRGRSPRQSLSLLPQAPRSLLVFLVTALLFTLGSLAFENEHRGLGRFDGAAFFSLYLLFSIVASMSALRLMRESERLLRAFVASDLAPLKRRVAVAVPAY